MTDIDSPPMVFHMARLPVALHQRMVEHHEELQRELQLMLISDGDIDVPRRLVDLLGRLTARYEPVSEEQAAAIAAASSAGETAIDLDYHLPREVAQACIDLAAMLDETDSFLRSGADMLTLATPDDLVVYRRWLFGEFVAQAAGLPPLAWPDADHAALARTPALRGS